MSKVAYDSNMHLTNALNSCLHYQRAPVTRLVTAVEHAVVLASYMLRHNEPKLARV